MTKVEKSKRTSKKWKQSKCSSCKNFTFVANYDIVLIKIQSINPHDVGDLNAQLMNVSEQMATVRQDKARAQPKGLMNEYFKISFEISVSSFTSKNIISTDLFQSQYRTMNEQELRNTMDTSCDLDLLHDLHRELQRRLGLNGESQVCYFFRKLSNFVLSRRKEASDI